MALINRGVFSVSGGLINYTSFTVPMYYRFRPKTDGIDFGKT